MNAFLSNWRRTLYLVFFLALLTRVAFILTQQDGFYFPDSTMDSQTAVKLLSVGEFGGGFGRAPGYPVFLAAVYWLFGESIFAIRLVESFMGALLAVIIAQIGRRVGGEMVGALAGVVWAVYPLGIFVAGLVYPTGLTAMFLACGVYCLLPATHEELSAKGVFAGGLFFGLAALTIPVALLTIVVVAGWVFFWVRRCRFRLAALLLLGAAVSLAPWTARNFFVLGRLVPVQANFEGHVRIPVGMTSDGRIMTVQADPRSGGVSAIFRRLDLYTVRFRRNFVHFWELYPSGITMNEKGYRENLHAKDSRIVEETIYAPNRLITTISILSTGPVFFFALVGTAAMWLRKDLRRQLSILWIMALSFAVGYALVYGKMRYRIPVEPYIIILGAYGIHATYAIILAHFKSVLPSSGSIISGRST
jgi:4-amino-4-deoxy-L-arabinose transferase-like glycosyltransferase